MRLNNHSLIIGTVICRKGFPFFTLSQIIFCRILIYHFSPCFSLTTPYVYKNLHSPMNKERVSIDRLKRLAIIALIIDDYLMET